MTREEILKYINYQGKNTKEVQKKINKLLKKYHPDNNKNDKKTILIIYEIRDQIKNGTLDYKEKSKEEKVPKNYVSLLEGMIKRLINKRKRIDKKIELLYKKLNFHYEKINNKQDEISFIEMNISNEKDELDKLLKRDIIDSIIITIFLICFIFMIIFKNILFSIGIIVLIIMEIYYIYLRKKIYEEKKIKLEKMRKIKKNVDNEFNSMKNSVEELKVDERKLKDERSKINNDISYYSHELSNIKNKELSKENSYVDENKKGFVKK